MTTAKELLEQATPLPWLAEGVAIRHALPSGFIEGVAGAGEYSDAALIVYAVNRLPDYEAAVDALEGFISCQCPIHAAEARAALARLRGAS